MKKKTKDTASQNLLALLKRIDDGYTPTMKEESDLLEITEIDFSSLSLTMLPESLGYLTSLRTLNINDNKLSTLPDSIGQLATLQKLDLDKNRFTELPESISQLTSLTELRIANNKLSTLPEGFGKLTTLQKLCLNRNSFTNLPETIGQITSLLSLEIGDNELTTLPEYLGKLTALQYLDLTNNELSALPESICRLTMLQKLFLGGNKLTSLPERIGQLAALDELNLTRNKLTILPESIGNLISLQKLGIGGNNLAELPSTLSEITHLQELYLWGHKMTNLPPFIFQFYDLQLLDISHSPIQKIPPQISQLNCLKKLDITGLNLHRLPAEIMKFGLPFRFNYAEWRENDGIYLEDTTLATQPISLFMQPRELVQAYFDMEQIPINEGKVIFLGYGDVGKSYSIQRILNHDEPDDFKTNMTPGISISHFPVEQDGRQFSICFWDFGGQEIMHAMHRCFLTHRTCYVVMVSNRQPDLDGQARYWLRNVESFASGSEVLLVINRWEDYPSNKDLNYTQLCTDFKNLVGCVSVSAKCDDTQTFHKLTKRIIQMAAKLDSTGMNFPIQWYNIRQSLMKMAKEGTYYINQDDYYHICTENGLKDANIRMWLLEWFNDLGTCFSYHQDTDKKELEEYKVLNPEWLTNAIYVLILNGKKFTENGVIPRKGIEYLLSNPIGGTLSGVAYNSEECGYVLEVMRKFTLSYSVSETEEFIPALCPNETPKHLYPTQYKKHLAYELEYTYLPDSVVHQLMIYCYQYLKLDKCWRKGMSIDIRGIEMSAIVNMGGSDHLLRIDVYSYDDGPLWRLLQPLLDAIQRINANLNLNATDYVYAETVANHEIFRDRYELDYILNVKKGNSRRKPSDWLQGKKVDHSIPELLAELYGEENIAVAESEFQQSNEAELTQSLLAGATLNNCMLFFGNYNGVNIETYQDISREILEIILNNQEKTTESFLNELAYIFAVQPNAEIKQLGEAMQDAQKTHKSIFDVLHNWLENSTNLTSVAANLYTVWPAIKTAAQKAPAIAAQINDLLANIPHP